MMIPLDYIHLIKNDDGTYKLISKFNYCDLHSVNDCEITIPRLKLDFKNLTASNSFIVSVEVLENKI